MRNLRDALRKITKALANGAAAVVSGALDMGPLSNVGSRDTNFDFQLSAPAMNTAQMPDGKTMTYDIVFSDNADLSAPTNYITAAIVQTGAGGEGCAAQTFRFGIASDAKQYVGFRATGSAAGDASGASATLEQIF